MAYHPPALVFLSARPHAYKGWSEKQFFSRLAVPLVGEGRMHAMPTLLPGSLKPALRPLLVGLWYGIKASLIRGEGMPTNVWYAVGMRKHQMFMEFASCYPECRFVFVGDNGQGDPITAELIASTLGRARRRSMDHPLGSFSSTDNLSSPLGAPDGRLLACYIHEVIPRWRTASSHEPDQRETQWKHQGIHFCHTYIGAAVAAHRGGLLSAAALHRVAQEATADYKRLAARFALLGGTNARRLDVDCEVWRRRASDLNVDIAAANSLLDAQQFRPVEFVDYLPCYPNTNGAHQN